MFGGNLCGFRGGFVLQLDGEERGTGNGGSAALAKETGFGDAIGFGLQAGGEVEDVAAYRIGDVDGSGGVGEFSSVAWGLEVVEDGGTEHGLSIPRWNGSGNGS